MIFKAIKKGISKAWKGVKKVVKGVAKGVKKVAKGIVTSTPWGNKVWNAGRKAWGGIKKTIGKFASKLGPVGTMALSFVLAPVMGPALGALWGGFGKVAAGMAASANGLAATLGTVGKGIYAAGNFAGGTLGAMGKAIGQGAKNVISGNFSAGAKAFASNISNALTGKAGMASVHAGNISATASAASDLAAQGGSAKSVNALTQSGGESLAKLNKMGQLGADTVAGLDPTDLAAVSNKADTIQQAVQGAIDSSTVPLQSAAMDPNAPAWMKPQATLPNSPALKTGTPDWLAGNAGMTSEQLTNKVMAEQGIADVGIYQNTAANLNAGNMAFDAVQGTSVAEGAAKAKSRLASAGSLLGGGGSYDSGYQPYVPQPISSAPIKAASSVRGQGSAGFSLLGGVQGLEESLRNSQQLMFG